MYNIKIVCVLWCMFVIMATIGRQNNYLYRCTSHFVVYFSNTPANAHIQSFNNPKFTLKYLKRSYMFRSYDHPQGGILCSFDVTTSIFRNLRVIVDLFHVLYCSGSMCVGVTVWFGWGGVASLCRLKQCCSEQTSSETLLV